MLKQEDVQLIHQFVDGGLKALKENDLMIAQGAIPPEMQDDTFDRRKDYNSWVAIPSRVTNAEIAKLEAVVDRNFPESFRCFLKYKHFYELFLPGVMEVGFYSHPLYNWQKKYLQMYSYDWVQEDIIQQGFVPFADHEDWGMLCFDARKPIENNEYPIIMIDQELVREEEKYERFNLNFMEMVKKRLI